jgi:hypothetical protein
VKLLFIALCTLLGLLAVIILGEILPSFPPLGVGYRDWFSGAPFLLIGTLQLWRWWRTPPSEFVGMGPWWASYSIAVGLMDLLSHSGPALHYGSRLLVLGISLKAVVVEWRKAWWSGLAVGVLWATFLVATVTDALSIPVPREMERAAAWTLLCGGAAWLAMKAWHAIRRSAPVSIRSEL